jgi:hypothetical protein
VTEIRGLRTRFCRNCGSTTPNRTLYVKTETGGQSRWSQVFWACTECDSLNRVVLPLYRLVSVPSELPSPLVALVVEALKAGPRDGDELLSNLRRRRDQQIRHISSLDVGMAIVYLKSRGVVAEETLDRTASIIDALRASPWKSKHLSPCPAELEKGVVMKSLVSVYAQRQVSGTHCRRAGSVGVLCLSCLYCSIDLESMK